MRCHRKRGCASARQVTLTSIIRVAVKSGAVQRTSPRWMAPQEMPARFKCRPLRRVGPQDILLVDLHIADAQAPAARIKPDFAAIHHGAVDEGPRDDSPESLDGERPVDVETAIP